MGLGALLLCAVHVGPRRCGRDGGVARVDRGQPDVARRAGARVAANASRRRRRAALGALLGRRFGAGGRAVGAPPDGSRFPRSPQTEALLIVCLFGVVLGGLNLTAVYRPSFYGFVLPALVPLIVRVAWVGDTRSYVYRSA